jgi:hypothetical protein
MGYMDRAAHAALILAASAVMSARAEAQQPESAVATPATKPVRGPRIAYAADAPKPQPAPVAVYFAPPVYYYTVDGSVAAAPSYLVLNDGSLLVNFGGGYERVLRSCAAFQPATVVRDAYGRDALGNLPDPPGIAAMKAGSRGQVSGVTPAGNAVACYDAVAQGRVQISAPR